MYTLASKLRGLPVLSLQTGEPVVWVRRPVIDIATLELMAFECETPARKHPLILVPSDIRQLAADCIIIDSEEELADPEDIVRLEAIIHAGYTPIEKNVVSDIGRKLGTVEDYSVNLETSRIQTLYVRQSLLRAWLSPNLTIDRTQILDVTPQRITVRDAVNKQTVMPTDPIPEINP